MKNVFLTITLLLAMAGYAESYVLTLYADGCSTPNVITCPSGQQVRITAEATQEGSRFVRWSDGNTDNPRTITLTANTTLTAEYESTVCTLTLYAKGCGTPNVITCPLGQQVRITAEASQAGCDFVRWSDGNTDNPRIITLTEDTTLTAEYNSFTLVDGTAYTTVSAPMNLTYQRTVYDNDWNLLYVPFKLDIEVLELSHDIQVYALNMFHQYDDDNNGTFERMTMEVLRLKQGYTVANHPYLFKYTGALTTEEQQNGKTLELNLGTTTLAAADSYSKTLSSMSFDYALQGTYTAIPQAAAADCYTLVWNSSLGACTFGHPTGGILPQRWYFTMTAADSQYTLSSGAPIRIVVAGEEDQVISNLRDVSNNAPASKKIVNGQVLIIRGGKVYDLMGRPQ